MRTTADLIQVPTWYNAVQCLSTICFVFRKHETHPEAVKVYEELRRFSLQLAEVYRGNEFLLTSFKDKRLGEKMDIVREHVLCTLRPNFDQGEPGYCRFPGRSTSELSVISEIEIINHKGTDPLSLIETSSTDR